MRSCRALLLCHVPKGMLTPPNPTGGEGTRKPSSIPPTRDPELIKRTTTGLLAGGVPPGAVQGRGSWGTAGAAALPQSGTPQAPPPGLTAGTACGWQLTGTEGPAVGRSYRTSPEAAAAAGPGQPPLSLGPQLCPPPPLGAQPPGGGTRRGEGCVFISEGPSSVPTSGGKESPSTPGSAHLSAEGAGLLRPFPRHRSPAGGR